MKLKAAIFDMDGLLINSEPFWQEAEKKIFSTVGIDLTTAMCEQTMGMRIDEVVDHWYNFNPWSGSRHKEIENEILDEVERLILERGAPMPGVHHIISFFAEKKFKLALASSAHLRLIKTVLNKFNMQNTFEVVHSAEFEAKGKPDPSIYLSAAKFLGVNADECVAFEDSYNGLLSAKSAGMRTVAIPAPEHFNDEKFLIASMKLHSLAEMNDEILARLD